MKGGQFEAAFGWLGRGSMDDGSEELEFEVGGGLLEVPVAMSGGIEGSLAVMKLP